MKTGGFRASVTKEELKQDAQTQVPDTMKAVVMCYVLHS